MTGYAVPGSANPARLAPEFERLGLLPSAGWRFASMFDEDGQLDRIIGCVSREDATDVLWIYARTDCLALRLLNDTPGARGGVVWHLAGEVTDCVAALLALPPPGAKHAPRLVKATVPALWRP